MASKSKSKNFTSLFDDNDSLESPYHQSNAALGNPPNRSTDMKQTQWSDEDSDVSDADPDEILKKILDYDELEAEHFPSLKKPSLAPAKKQPHGIETLKNDSAKTGSDVESEGGGEVATIANRPNSAFGSTAKKKVTFTEEVDDEDFGQMPRAKDHLKNELLSKETQPTSDGNLQESRGGKSTSPLSASPLLRTRTSAESGRKRNPLLFDDDQTDDLLDALGFDANNNNSKKKDQASWLNSDRAGPHQRVRTRVDDILENLNSPHPLERPRTGEKDPLVEQKQKEKSAAGKESGLQEDLTFGSYQPSLGPKLRGPQPRRPSLRNERFTSEEPSFAILEKKPKPTSSSRDRRGSDWLGLKLDDDLLAADATNAKTPAESPLLEKRPSLADNHATSAEALAPSAPTDEAVNETKQQASKSQPKEEDKDDWLAGVLRKKALPQPSFLERRPSSADSQVGSAPAASPSLTQTNNTAKEVEPEASKTQQEEEEEEDWLAAALRRKSRLKAEDSGLWQDQGSPVSKEPVSVAPRGRRDPFPSVKESSLPEQPGHSISSADEKGTVQASSQLNQGKTSAAAVQQQVTPSQSQRGHTEPGDLQRVRERKQQAGGDQAFHQARVIQLEGQVKTLELAQEQSKMLLENVQVKHKQDMELMENTYKTKIKWLEESAAQRETMARQECDDLRGRFSEQQAEYQRKLDQAKQDRDQEVEQLRDVHRKSISEMRKDHEDQIQHLKRLKNDEIDVVKSATSQSRSLTVVTEQMEQFSSHLGELCSFSVMQDRLAEQQKAAVEERAFLKDIISRMHTQLREQERQFEKERWKATAEEAKVESAQRSLEEERRALGKEREDLERAKSAMLEEQKSVMEHCTAERRRLDAEWASFHSAEKQRQEQVEKVSSLLEKRESAIITLANEQADLKLRAAELKQKENSLAQERESLERLKEELESSKKKISSMESRLSTQIQEVEALRKLAVQKYRTGEVALQEARSTRAEQEAHLTELPPKREQHVLQEHMRISRVQKEIEQWRTDPPLTSGAQMELPVFPGLYSTLPKPVCPPSNVDDAFVALWKYMAQKDQEHLQEEEIYLQNLERMLAHSGHQ